MDADTLKFMANFLAKKIAAYLAATLVTLGALHPGSDETQFTTLLTGIIVGLAAFVWSWWNDRGKQKVLAALAKAHKVAPADASVAAASKAIVTSVNDDKVIPAGNGAVKIVGALLFCFFVCSLAFPAHAAAQADPIQALINKLTSANAQVVQNTIAALQHADADAATVVNSATGDVKDPISHACYPAQIRFLQSMPAAVNITDPAPYNLIVLFQLKRDFVAQIKAGIPPYLAVGCSALLGDEVQTFIKTLALIGITVTASSITPLLTPAALVPVLPAITPVIAATP